MHRLVVRAVEEFLRDTYGDSLWRDVLARVGTTAAISPSGSRPETAPRGIPAGGALVAMAAEILGKTSEEMFEDLGAWLARREAIRRLLRFSGRDFRDFVLSIEELPGRAHFVIPELDMPRITVTHQDGGTIRLSLPPDALAWTAILGGLLRAMADDYGALGLIVIDGSGVEVHISDESFSEGRDFNLGRGFAADAARTS